MSAMDGRVQKLGTGLMSHAIVILGFILAMASGSCPGFRHEVVIPNNYYKNVPDSVETGNVTIVNFTYHIDRIQFVDEDM